MHQLTIAHAVFVVSGNWCARLGQISDVLWLLFDFGPSRLLAINSALVPLLPPFSVLVFLVRSPEITDKLFWRTGQLLRLKENLVRKFSSLLKGNASTD